MYSFIIPGQPHGKASVRMTRQGRTYMPVKTRNYMAKVKRCASGVGGTIPDVPYWCRIEAVFSAPKSAKQRIGGPHWVKPDADNIAKSVMDGMTKAGKVPDDARCCDLHVRKRYAREGEAAHVLVEYGVFG